MKLNREELIQSVMTWNKQMRNGREPRIDTEADAKSLAHAIVGGWSWTIERDMATVIRCFAVEAAPLKIDLGYRETAALLVDVILQDTVGVTEEKPETDLSGIAAGSPEAVMAMMRG